MTKLLHFFLLFMNVSYLSALHVSFEFQGVQQDALPDVERVWIGLSQAQQAVGMLQLMLGLHKFRLEKLLAHLLAQGFLLGLTSISACCQQQSTCNDTDTRLLHFVCKGKKKREKCQIYEK